jgi:MFS family permease
MSEASLTRTTAQQGSEAMTAEAKSTIWGAFMGFFVDMYDVYLPIVALTPALIYFQPKGLPAAAATTVFYVVFAVTLIGRPIGSFIFGHLGDKIGRRKTTMIAVTGFGLVTMLIALLPGYQAIGMAALVLLVLLRLIDGVFLGGEYTAASPLAMEYCPKSKRGFYSAVIQAGYPIAYVAISLLVALMLFVAPAKGGLNSPYVQWGWRIPFIVGALIALAFVLWFRRVPESRSWMESEKTENPIKTLFSGESRKAFLQVFVVMSGFWLALNTTISTLPQVLTRTAGLSTTRVTMLLLVANVVLVGGYLVFGVIGQRIGRRPTMMLLGLLITVVSTSAYVVLVQTAGHVGLLEVGLLATLITVLTVSGWGLLSAYINERFHIGVRASGFGIGYSLAVILPAFYSFVMLWMASFMPYKYTQIPLLALGGLLILLGAAMGPETKDVDIAEPAKSSMDRPDLTTEAAGRTGDRRGMVPS